MTAHKISIAIAAAALSAVALTGCTSSGSTTGRGAGAYGSGGSGSASSSSSSAGSGGTTPPATGGGASAASVDGNTLATASTALGRVVVDGQGMTVYFYGPDTRGESASTCTGACASLWPPVTASSAPKATGVTGTVGTIAGPNDTRQVTINGLPIYTYAGDSAKGDVNGQLVGNVWWAVSPSGAKITKPAVSSSRSGY